ncbi:MAG: helix-turn-helix transcriptional regulator [Actinomycetota bacterium]
MSATAAERLSRLLALVPWLTQHDGISITEAARHFGVTPGELERDLWLVVCCGLPGHGPDQLIDIQFWDAAGIIEVIDPQTLERPLRLSIAEATALAVGLRMLAQVPGSHERGAIASATAKLEEAAGAALDAGQSVVVVETTPDTVRSVRDDALARRRALHLMYAGATRYAITNLVVDPRAVVHQDGFDYLDAWCRDAGAQRTFRLDRVVSARVLDEPAAVPDDLAPPATAPTSGVPVRLAFTESAAWVLDALDLVDVVRDPGHGGRATLRVADRAWIVRLVLGQGGNLVIEAPEDLRQEVAASAQAALSRP